MKHGRFNDIEVFADGEKLNEKQILLATLAQGQYVGGQFRCAPKSANDDGLIDVCVLKTMTFLGLGMIIGTYTKGGHLDKPRKNIVYRRAQDGLPQGLRRLRRRRDDQGQQLHRHRRSRRGQARHP